MINSLSKDSHITQSLLHSQFSSGSCTNKKERQEYSIATAKNSIGISVKNPAEISFSGISSYKLAETSVFKTLVKNAKAFLGEKTDNKTVTELINGSIDFIRSLKTETKLDVEKFVNEQKENLNDVIEQTKEFMTEEFVKKDDKDLKGTVEKIKDFHDTFWGKRSEAFKSNMKEAVEHLPNMENQGKDSKLSKSNTFKKFLNFAADKQAIFSAVFAVGLTCILRPATIMVLPTNKKNNDDKKYAAGHSIASGVIGYIMSLILFNPIATAMKKVANEPDKFAKGIKRLENKYSYLNEGKAAEAAGTYIKMLPEAILAAPRAVVTVALIPVILKYVFGWEKKKPEIKNVETTVVQHPQDKFVSQKVAGGVK